VQLLLSHAIRCNSWLFLWLINYDDDDDDDDVACPKKNWLSGNDTLFVLSFFHDT